MSDFWRSHDPETGQLIIVLYLRRKMEEGRMARVRLRELAEAQPK